jgi:hypothetical protein
LCASSGRSEATCGELTGAALEEGAGAELYEPLTGSGELHRCRPTLSYPTQESPIRYLKYCVLKWHFQLKEVARTAEKRSLRLAPTTSGGFKVASDPSGGGHRWKSTSARGQLLERAEPGLRLVMAPERYQWIGV